MDCPDFLLCAFVSLWLEVYISVRPDRARETVISSA
jgi:hypothetical protein